MRHALLELQEMQAVRREASSLIFAARSVPREYLSCPSLGAAGECLPCKCYFALMSLSGFSASPVQRAEGLKEKLTVIRMPQLSPNMTSGTIKKWHKQPGEEIVTYDVVMEVDTDTLSEEGYKIGDFAGTVTMIVEAQEDGFLSSILIPERQDVAVHTPIATMCEFEEDLDGLSNSQQEVDKLLEDSRQLRQMTWQSYLKESSNGGEGCS